MKKKRKRKKINCAHPAAYMAAWAVAFAMTVGMVVVVLAYGLKFEIDGKMADEDLQQQPGVNRAFTGPIYYEGYSEFDWSGFEACKEVCDTTVSAEEQSATLAGEEYDLEANQLSCYNRCDTYNTFSSPCESACLQEEACVGVTYRPVDGKCFAMGGEITDEYSDGYLSRFRQSQSYKATLWQTAVGIDVGLDLLIMTPFRIFLLFMLRYYFLSEILIVNQGMYHDWLRANGMNFNRPPRDNPLFFPVDGKLVHIELVVDDVDFRDKAWLDQVLGVGAPLAEIPTDMFDEQLDGMNGDDELFLDELIDAGAKLYVNDLDEEFSTSEEEDEEDFYDDEEEWDEEEWDEEEWDDEEENDDRNLL